MLRRKTVIKILKRLSAGPIRFVEIRHSNFLDCAAQLHSFLQTDFPRGVRGLVTVELWPSVSNRAVKMLVLQPAGFDLLKRLEKNPHARPPKSIHQREPFVTATSTEFQKARNEKFFRERRRALRHKMRMARRAARNEEPPDPEVYREYVPNAESMTWQEIGRIPRDDPRRIAALRTRAGLNQPEDNMDLTKPKPDWCSEEIWNLMLEDAKPKPASVAESFEVSLPSPGESFEEEEKPVSPSPDIDVPEPSFKWDAPEFIPSATKPEESSPIFYRATFYPGYLWSIDGSLVSENRLPSNAIIRGDIGNPPEVEKAFLYRISDGRWVKK